MFFQANPNILDKKGNAPIHVAAFEDYDDVVELLTSRTSKRQIQNICGRSPLVSCFEEDTANYDSLEVLLKWVKQNYFYTRQEKNILV